MVRAIGLLAVANGILIGVPSHAQSPAVSKPCSSPTVANEKPQANADGEVRAPEEKYQAFRKVIIDRIEFDRPVMVSPTDVEQVIKNANKHEWGADSSDWVNDLSEWDLRGAWQDQGYLKAALEAHAQPAGGDPDHEHFIVMVHVVNEGPQYHLGNLEFVDSTVFPEAELGQVFSLREGEIFNIQRVREGIEGLTKLYGSRGYIDFTMTPETEVDDKLQRISLVMHLDEQRQYHVGSINMQGLDSVLETRLRAIIVPGEVFNAQAFDEFFKENRSGLPTHGVDNFDIRLNSKAGIVDLTFAPRRCP